MITISRRILFFVLYFCLFAGSLMAADCRRPEFRKMGKFADFICALQDAGNAHDAGDDELEQQHLKRAEKVLDTMSLSPSSALIRQDFKGIMVQNAFSRVHGQKSSRLKNLYDGLFDITRGGLYEHLDDAIKSHESRMPYYSSVTNGKSDAIFKKIAGLQTLNLPISWYIDLQAKRFQRLGIPVITGDLINMNTINPKEQPPIYQGIMPEITLKDLRIRMREFQKKAVKALKKSDFMAIAQATHEIIMYVKELEKTHDAHLAMTVHMLDSIGYTALHAADHQQQTHGDTDNLYRQFLTIQIFPMQQCLPTDLKAQQLHALGAGVIVNDVPDIPFLKEWNARLKN